MGLVVGIALVLGLGAGSAVASTLYATLSVGSTGEQVTSLQTSLAANPSIYPEGIVSGYFGALTRAAVVRYQAAHGISQTGTVGPITRASINGSTGTVFTGDENAPLIGADSVSVGSNSATISWNTSEPATARVYYSTTWPFVYSISLQASDSSFGAGHNVVLSGLASHGTYYYAKESVDSSGNIMWTTAKTFTTNQ